MPVNFIRPSANPKAAPIEYLKILGCYVPICFEDVAENLKSIGHIAKAKKHADKKLKATKEALALTTVSSGPELALSLPPFAPKCTGSAKFKKRTNIYYSSKLCLQAAMFEANRRRRLHNRISPHQLIQLSHQYDVLKELNETVTIHKVKKSDGSGFRLLHDFGPVARGAQLMVIDMLAMTYTPKPFQYSNLGSGQKVELALDLIANQGYGWFCEVDIVKFFESYELKTLVEALPLPKEVVTQIVGAHSATWVYPLGTKYPPLSPKAHPGIPQGSSASNEVARWSVAQLAMPELGNVVLINHVDNFYLLATNFKSLEDASKALRAAIGGCPGGSFEGKIKQLTSITDGFCMLGCWLFDENGKVIALPTNANLKNFETRFNNEYLQVKASLEIAKLSNKAEHRLQGTLSFVQLGYFVEAWINAFSFCETHFIETIRSDRISFLNV